MLSSIIKLKLEKKCCSYGALEYFFAKKVFNIDDRKRFKEPSVKLVMKYYYDSTLILTLPREAIPNSFALELFSSLYKENELALPIILKYLVQRNLSKDFDEISKKLQSKMDQDIQEAQLQHNSKISKGIELCKEDILNVLDGGKSVLSGQLKQKYYSILENEVKGLRDEISKELEDYTNNTNIHKMYQSLNNKIKKIKYYKKDETVSDALMIFGIAALSALFVAPMLTLVFPSSILSAIFFLENLMYVELPCLVVATLALIIAGIVYLVIRNYEQSFTKEMQDYIEEPKCIDKATNNEDVGKLETKEGPVLVVDNLIDLNYDEMEDKVQPSAPPLSEMKLKAGESNPLDLSKSGRLCWIASVG